MTDCIRTTAISSSPGSHFLIFLNQRLLVLTSVRKRCYSLYPTSLVRVLAMTGFPSNCSRPWWSYPKVNSSSWNGLATYCTSAVFHPGGFKVSRCSCRNLPTPKFPKTPDPYQSGVRWNECLVGWSWNAVRTSSTSNVHGSALGNTAKQLIIYTPSIIFFEVEREWSKGLAVVKVEIAREFDSVRRDVLLRRLHQKLGNTEEFRVWHRLMSDSSCLLCSPWNHASFARCWNPQRGGKISTILCPYGERKCLPTRTCSCRTLRTWMIACCGKGIRANYNTNYDSLHMLSRVGACGSTSRNVASMSLRP